MIITPEVLNEQKNDFIDCVSAFSEIIDTGNRINTTGATF